MKIFSLFSVAKLYYLKFKSCRQPYFLDVESHSAEKDETQRDEEAKMKASQSPNGI